MERAAICRSSNEDRTPSYILDSMSHQVVGSNACSKILREMKHQYIIASDGYTGLTT
jgi:hypothetical protein